MIFTLKAGELTSQAATGRYFIVGLTLACKR